MISHRRIVDATVEPVTVKQAKDQCRINNDLDDAKLAGYIVAARQYAENRTGRALLPQTWLLSRSHFPGYFKPDGSPGYVYRPQLDILLPRTPLIAVQSITYMPADGSAAVTLDPSTYVTDLNAEPGRIAFAGGSWWPAALRGRSNAVQVTYRAGYGSTPASVPQTIQLAILGLVAHWYENREAVVLTNSPNAVTTVPLFVDELLDSEAAPTIFSLEN